MTDENEEKFDVGEGLAEVECALWMAAISLKALSCAVRATLNSLSQEMVSNVAALPGVSVKKIFTLLSFELLCVINSNRKRIS